MCLYKGVKSIWFGINPLVIGDYNMTKSATLPSVSLDTQFKLGRKSYTMASAIDHVVACYDKLHLLQEESLDLYREIGNFIIQTKGLFGNNKKAYGQFIATTDFNNDAVSQPDKYDSEFIATHWAKIQTLNKSGKLLITHSCGGDSIQKILKIAFKEKEAFPNTAKDIIEYLKNNPIVENNKFNFGMPKSYFFNFRKAPDQTVTELFGHNMDAKWANILYVGQIPEKDIQGLEKNQRAFNKVKKAIDNEKLIQFKNEIFSITKLR